MREEGGPAWEEHQRKEKEKYTQRYIKMKAGETELDRSRYKKLLKDRQMYKDYGRKIKHGEINEKRLEKEMGEGKMPQYYGNVLYKESGPYHGNNLIE